MYERLQNVTEELSRSADDARTSFGGFSPAQLNWKPDDKSWSVAQCLEHLIASHKGYIPLFQGIAVGDAKPTFWEKMSPLSGYFGRYLIKSLDPANLKQMKAPGKAQPSASEISGDIVDQFCDQQRQLIEQIGKIPAGVDAAKTIVTSPLLGLVTYSLDDCYSILIVHCQRHIGQARRVTENPEFPQKITG